MECQAQDATAQMDTMELFSHEMRLLTTLPLMLPRRWCWREIVNRHLATLKTPIEYLALGASASMATSVKSFGQGPLRKESADLCPVTSPIPTGKMAQSAGAWMDTMALSRGKVRNHWAHVLQCHAKFQTPTSQQVLIVNVCQDSMGKSSGMETKRRENASPNLHVPRMWCM